MLISESYTREGRALNLSVVNILRYYSKVNMSLRVDGDRTTTTYKDVLYSEHPAILKRDLEYRSILLNKKVLYERYSHLYVGSGE